MFKKTILLLYILLSILFLVYLVLPGPKSIADFPALPNSIKSSLEGDTIQIPNVAAYFSDNFRNFATNYYKKAFQDKTMFPFPPMRLNHPPEFAFTAIKDQTQSTYLEEYTYPFRQSIYVNGLEPLNEDGTPRYQGGDKIKIDGGEYSTKVTLRFYSSRVESRIIMWIGVNLSIIMLYMLGKKLFK